MEVNYSNGVLKVRITAEEYKEIEELGKQRQANDLDCTKDETFGFTNISANTKGTIGEGIFSMIYCLPTPQTLRPDNGHDFIIEGRKIDVKYRSRQYADLTFRQDRPFKADIAVLIVPTKIQFEYRIVGWTNKEHFNQYNHRLEWGLKGNEVGLEQRELLPISTFLEQFPLPDHWNIEPYDEVIDTPEPKLAKTYDEYRLQQALKEGPAFGKPLPLTSKVSRKRKPAPSCSQVSIWEVGTE